MSLTLRILLLILSFISAIWILSKIRRLKVKMEDAIFWIFFAVILCLLGIFPDITYWLTGKVGMMSPANLIFLIVIILLLEKVFTLSIIVSQLEDKITVLTAEIAIRDHSLIDQTEKLKQEGKPMVQDQEEAALALEE